MREFKQKWIASNALVNSLYTATALVIIDIIIDLIVVNIELIVQILWII